MDRLNLKLIAISLLFISVSGFSQDTLELDDIKVTQKRKFGVKKIGLYEGEMEEVKNVRGFSQLDIFKGSLGDAWTSEGKKCISHTLVSDANENILKVSWNKDQDGCDWVGMGFGWDGWKGKDLGYVVDTLALELIVRSTGDPFTNIPWAFCLEDYSGGQAWLGYNTKFLKADKITNEWTKVQIPLILFPFEEFDADPTNIKQLLIQVFADGEIEIKSIELIPFAGKTEEEAIAVNHQITNDGSLNEWTDDFYTVEKHEFAVSYTESHLNFAFKIIDDSPRQNGQSKADLWNGDAIEIAFSTNYDADPKRPFLLLSDQHIGLNCGEKPYLWDWKRNQVIEDAVYTFKATDNGYQVEISIPVNYFMNFQLKSGKRLDFEVAIDLGNRSNRTQQIRWNSSNQEGFHQSPKLWGGLIIE